MHLKTKVYGIQRFYWCLSTVKRDPLTNTKTKTKFIELLHNAHAVLILVDL